MQPQSIHPTFYSFPESTKAMPFTFTITLIIINYEVHRIIILIIRKKVIVVETIIMASRIIIKMVTEIS